MNQWKGRRNEEGQLLRPEKACKGIAISRVLSVEFPPEHAGDDPKSDGCEILLTHFNNYGHEKNSALMLHMTWMQAQDLYRMLAGEIRRHKSIRRSTGPTD